MGRTGAFIAIDQCLDQVEKEQEVDIFRVTEGMRTCRADMIQLQVHVICWPLHKRFDNLCENSVCCNFILDYPIMSQFCTWHDSLAVMPCAKL